MRSGSCTLSTLSTLIELARFILRSSDFLSLSLSSSWFGVRVRWNATLELPRYWSSSCDAALVVIGECGDCEPKVDNEPESPNVLKSLGVFQLSDALCDESVLTYKVVQSS